MKIRKILSIALGIVSAVSMDASRVLDIPMNISGQTAVSAEGKQFAISDQKGAMEIAGLDGRAWRTDGHTSYLSGNVDNLVDGSAMSVQVAFAIDTNVIIEHDEARADENGWAKFVDCLNGNSGFAFSLSRRGQYKFQVYVGGELVEIESNRDADNGKLQLWQWYELSGIVNGSNVKLYLNGTLIGEKSASSTGVKVNGELLLGRDKNINGLYCGNFRVGDFNGAIDYLRVDNSAITPAAYNSRYADLNLPSNRYAADNLRAKYHGQPGMNWTNETHGLLYNEKDGKYHVIFQRTGSIPGMSHAHYGHIVSDDLFNWRDDKPMIWPSEDFDCRGCWSGCIFKDSKINGGKPSIIYTGVEYGRTSHANIAFCDDDVNLRAWHKTGLGNPLTTYGNTARDTYFFRVDDNNAYFIIGDEGHMKSYRYNESNGSWNENGHFYDFLTGESGFTEMPNVAKLPNGKWLMTFTPWTGDVRCIYRIGEIDGSGKFVNPTESRLFDFYATNGFCLMSPTIGKDKDGNLVALGIVADKMSTEWNMEKGYAHLYSLPRQLGVDNNGNLTQKPFSGYEKMFGSVSYKLDAPTQLNGVLDVNPVRGREAEICATFTVGDASFGINFLQNAKGKGGKITYNPENHTINMDVSAIVESTYGFKTASYALPVFPAKGEDCKIQLFIDHSIVDLFVNDRYASSFRVFPESMEYDLIQVFSNGNTTIKELTAHILGEGDMRDEPIVPKEFKLPENSGKVAFLKSAAAMSQQEQAALDYYSNTLKLNNVITTSETSRIKASDFDCVWIHIDRIGIEKGYTNLPSEFISSELMAALKQYVADGGNLLLSGHATQLTVALNRIKSAYAPNEINTGEGGQGDDEWQVNPKLADKYDHKTHVIYKDMEESDAHDWVTYGLIYGGGAKITREDHNCLWRTKDYDYVSTAADRILKFEEDTHSSVLGTWGQDRSDEYAGVVEFYPVKNSAEEDAAYGGTILANGLAACQWYIKDGVNADIQNLQLFTANMIAYLADKNGNKPYNPGGGEVENPEVPDEPEIPEGPEVPETSGKIALFVAYNSYEELEGNPQELAVYNYFTENYDNAEVIYAPDYELINSDDFDCVWIHIDRTGLAQGWRNLPSAVTNDSFLAHLKSYYEDGGNLLLTKFANQLVVAIERTSNEPTEWNCGDGGRGDDYWTVNVHAWENDYSSHPMYNGLETLTTNDVYPGQSWYGKHIKLLGNPEGMHREDHNCLWKLRDFGGNAEFERANNCKVLGTWGHEDGRNFAAIVEWNPLNNGSQKAISQTAADNRKGTVMTIGLGGYEWAPRSGTNLAHSNVVGLTNNVLGYLAPAVAVEDYTAIMTIDGEESDTRYFNLQGVRVTNPQSGIYIMVKDGRSSKVLK